MADAGLGGKGKRTVPISEGGQSKARQDSKKTVINLFAKFADTEPAGRFSGPLDQLSEAEATDTQTYDDFATFMVDECELSGPTIVSYHRTAIHINSVRFKVTGTSRGGRGGGSVAEWWQ